MLGFSWTSEQIKLNKKNERIAMEKLNDKEKLFLAKLDENKPPKRTSELYRLFDRLARMSDKCGVHVEPPEETKKPRARSIEGLSHFEVKILTKEILTDQCTSMIRRLKEHVLKTDAPSKK
jgi:hypothetical protein